MSKTKKIQVTLDEAQYDKLAEIASREGRKLAAIVRESIEKYTLAPEAERSKREALEQLFSVDPAPVPKSYQDWKREYSARKTKTHRLQKKKR
ncbi:MAG: hypothetical protein E2P02_23300 [Acidobacteria bacterium]|nr:MAG: hypothetical protein E2P02_23300 [Acidobacteriota bacterium]